MPRFFIKNENISNEQEKVHIKGNDVKHIKNVLRLKLGDEIECFNQDTKYLYLCEIEEFSKEVIQLKIVEKTKEEESKVKVSIFQGLPKQEKMELIIQKTVELGGYDIYPIILNRTIVKLDEKDKIRKVERWQKISEAAAKQSGRNSVPIIRKINTIKEILEKVKDYDVFLVTYEKEKKHTLKQSLKQLKEKNLDKISIALLIGPEGGIEENEVKQLKDKGAIVVTLGSRILRTETVALNVLSNIMYELEEVVNE